jgi:glycosyltransferase involved in cell wall biosynthesis
MQIGVDLTAQDRYPFSGIAKSNRLTYEALARLRPDWTIEGFHRAGSPASVFVNGQPNVSERSVAMRGFRFFPGQDAWLDVALPLRAWLSRCDLLHCPGNAVPARSATPILAHILDLIPLQFYSDRDDVRRWALEMPQRLARCRRIVVPSLYVRDAVARWQPALADRLVMIYLGPTTAPPASLAFTAFDATLGLHADTSYLLLLGSGQPHKNNRRLIDAWCGVPDGIASSHTLLVTGLPAALRAECEAAAAVAGRSASCRFIESVPESELPRLIGRAAAICYPSLSEGFGLPVLDGFACGTAVITSKVTSIPEVGGDAVDYCDPESTESIRASIVRVLSDRAWRTELVERGRARVKQFTWERTAAALAEVMRDVAASA